GSFVPVESLPLTANGKLDRAALSAGRYESRLESAKVAVAPRNATETLLVDIWREVLGVSAIGVDDNYFDVGGHSLLAGRLTSRITKGTGAPVSVRDLFEQPTISELAEVIAKRGQADSSEATLIPVERTAAGLPLSYPQQRLWLSEQLDPGNCFNTVALAIRLEGVIDTEALRDSFRHLAARHEPLRTTIQVRNNQPVQVILQPAFDLAVIRFDGGSPEEVEARAFARIVAEASRPFDLARGPVLRALLSELGENKSILAVSIHHIAADGWSMSIL